MKKLICFSLGIIGISSSAFAVSEMPLHNILPLSMTEVETGSMFRGFKKLSPVYHYGGGGAGFILGKEADISFSIRGVVDEALSYPLAELKITDFYFGGLTAGGASQMDTKQGYGRPSLSIHGLENQPLANVCGRYQGAKIALATPFTPSIGKSGWTARNEQTGVTIGFSYGNWGLQADLSKISFNVVGCQGMNQDYVPKMAKKIPTDEMSLDTKLVDLSPTRWINSADDSNELILEMTSDRLGKLKDIESNEWACYPVSKTTAGPKKGERYLLTEKKYFQTGNDISSYFYGGYDLVFSNTSALSSKKFAIRCMAKLDYFRPARSGIENTTALYNLRNSISLGDLEGPLGIRFEIKH